MSIGIGRHKVVSGGTHPFDPKVAECPYCGNQQCHAEWVSTGIGLAQVGPFVCRSCHASEMNAIEDRQVTAEERQKGWFKPGSPLSVKFSRDEEFAF